MKPDRHELTHVLPNSFRNASEKHLDINMSYELEKRVNDLEKSTQLLNRDFALQNDQMKSLLSLNLQNKADFRDLDTLSHAIIGKADTAKVQELVQQLRNDLLSQLNQIKKDMAAKVKKKEEDAKKKIQDAKFESEKILEEVKANRDKIQKLAVQFDKELADRDKQQSGMRAQIMGELQKLGGHIQGDIEGVRKLLGDIEIKKGDKRDIIEFRSSLGQALDKKADLGDVHSILNKFTQEQTQKAYDLKQEVYKKVSDIQSLVSAGVGTKVSIEEFNEALSQKADLSTFRALMEQKANCSDIDSQ